ncbi:hypothetical protein HYT56_00115 [Candidatus Woesearchaeota archaeon]|nr:hypothetical protein [Candidatus Woesearchaeota archaeon]
MGYIYELFCYYYSLKDVLKKSLHRFAYFDMEETVEEKLDLELKLMARTGLEKNL